MTLTESIREKVSNHITDSAPMQQLTNRGEELTNYGVVKDCFDAITLFRVNEKDWGVTAKQVMTSFKTITGQEISISASTLKRYYYRIKAESGGKKKRKSKSKSDATKLPPVVEPAGVSDAGEDKAQLAADMPKDPAVAPSRGRKKTAANGGDSGFQVPRRPGIRPPTHWDG
jgi:hypothetical protein